jgi:hypothetical protein
MSEELAQDEADAEDYDMDALEARTKDDDDATLVGGRPGGYGLPPGDVADDGVVFEIGDEDGSDDEGKTPTRKNRERVSGDNERRGLMSDDR